MLYCMQDVHFFADHLRKSVHHRVTQAETRKKCRCTGGRTTEKEKNMNFLVQAAPALITAAIVIVVFFLLGYVKAPPDVA